MHGESIRSLSDSIVQHYKGNTFDISALEVTEIFYFFVRNEDQMVGLRQLVDVSQPLLRVCLCVDAASIVSLQ